MNYPKPENLRDTVLGIELMTTFKELLIWWFSEPPCEHATRAEQHFLALTREAARRGRRDLIQQAVEEYIPQRGIGDMVDGSGRRVSLLDLPL